MAKKTKPIWEQEWTPEDVEWETIVCTAPPSPETQLANWNRAIVLGGDYYKAWRDYHIAPLELRRKERCKEELQRRRERRHQRRRKAEEEASLREHDRRYYEQELLRATRLLVKQADFFNSLAGNPSMEDAILHVQKSLGCDRETARLKIREGFLT
jgi:hypothetical protein